MDPQERIVEKAQELFMRYGIRSISMDEIASSLGISKKTIYQFFSDKDALVLAVITREVECNVDECTDFRDQSENPIHEFFLAMEMVEDMLKVMNPMVFYDLQKYHPKAFKVLENHQHVYLYKMIYENLQTGVELGLYRPEIDISILTRYRLFSIFLLFNPDVFPLRKNNLNEVLREVTLNFLYGIATTKGQKLLQKYQQNSQKLHTNEEGRK